ncbi:hypothetical protein F2Y36_07935 [Bacteroides caccae]|uniref:Uncharacterized protein n=1 Tax=Bacteroides caccae TaxID=47678 RepID=A0A6L3KU68_9BACE|nr:hypothetical protein [Bacteroides caccae]KAA5444876.1 hypothetical protein F2Y45_08795 [Bacteroides caccae]KAA5464159.1 hypothetical protein F2Y36_07935 [Bacteroides caccae]MDU3579793.1 hypothetical protein [Bacteroides caccae]MDU3629073.1 hypothetical protein [Bacteroides caccae]MDU3672241.1 hypothetical protein [Bacteroides caccae]
MKSFRKTLRESRLRTHKLVRSWLQPKLGAIGIKYRLAGRIRLANIWAKKHPRRTFAYVTGSLLFVLVANIAMDGLLANSNELNEPNELNELSAIAPVDPMLEGFRTIQANKTVHRSTLMNLTAKGQLLHEELDSLIALPHKTHADSVHIIQSYRQLESIVKSLKNNDHP